MKIGSVFIKDLSLRVKVLLSESKKDIQDELASINSNVSENEYTSWVIDTYVVGVNRIYQTIVDGANGDPGFIVKCRESLYKEILKLNPSLNPNEIYVTQANTLSLNKDKVKLTECQSWKSDRSENTFLVFNIAEYNKIVEQARGLDHYVEMDSWDLIPDLLIGIRKFHKNLKTNLLHGYSPQTDDEIKFFITCMCVDNFHELYQYISSDPTLATIPFNKLIYSLYDIAIKHNEFLKVKPKDFDKINKNFKIFKAGSLSEAGSPTVDKQTRKTLASVPKKEILALESTIAKEIFGQDKAIMGVTSAIKRAYAGIKNPKTPIGAFFFYGGTSTGKTELAKVLAKVLTKSSSGLVKIACNTMVSSHNVHTLIGAPPGYVGYEDESILKKALSTNNFKVLLFDEIEKAHPKLLDMLLDVLEEGELLLANGETLALNNCLLIFTSNIGQQEANKAIKETGFSSFSADSETQAEKIQEVLYEKELRQKLKPEFLARLNGKYYFRNLHEEEFIKLAQFMLSNYQVLLSKKNLRIVIPPAIGNWVVGKCKVSSKGFHARDVRNYIEMQVLEKLGDFIIALKLDLTVENTIKLEVVDDIIAFNHSITEEPKTKGKKTK
jgi:ATP-dependent protease Clp ATPase subunit